MIQQFASRFPRKKIAVKQCTHRRTCDRAVRAYEADIQSQGLRNGKRKSVPAPSHQSDMNTGLVGPFQSMEIGSGDLEC